MNKKISELPIMANEIQDEDILAMVDVSDMTTKKIGVGILRDTVAPDITITAQIDGTSGTPTVEVTKKGTAREPKYELEFSGLKGEPGNDGVSVVSITQTETSTQDGGINKITATLSNGQTSEFQVRNGSTIIPFTYIVDSVSSLMDWINNNTDYDYTSVLIRRGEYTVYNCKINLDTTGTKCIVGEEGAVIYVRDVNAATMPTDSGFFERTAEPNDTQRIQECYYNLTVRITYAVNSHADYPFSAFKNLTNMYNCNAYITGVNSNSSYVKTTGFTQCSYLNNCFCYVSNGYSYNTAFYHCYYLDGCSAVAQGNRAWGFEGCHYINNSFATCTPNNSNGSAGFRTCSQVNNCLTRITNNTNYYSYAFDSCYELTNCRAEISTNNSGTGAERGFTGCYDLVNCIAIVKTTGGSARGFWGSYRLLNCQADATGGSTPYDYYSCRGMLFCRCADTNRSSTFSSCYYSIDTTYAAANTLNGGWNN